MEMQPDFPQKLYTVYSRAEGLHTKIDPEQELRYVVCSHAQRDQFFFQPGVAAGFLARLFQATGELKWLELAKQYMRFGEDASEYLFCLVRAGKVGWAAAILYTLTGENKYKDMAVRIAKNLIRSQHRTGSWSAVQRSGPDDEVTAEMTIWLDEIHQAVDGERSNSPTRTLSRWGARASI